MFSGTGRFPPTSKTAANRGVFSDEFKVVHQNVQFLMSKVLQVEIAYRGIILS